MRLVVAATVTAIFLGAVVLMVMLLVSLAGPVGGLALTTMLGVLLYLGANGRQDWLWSLLSIDEPLGWAGFLPPLWRWARRDDDRRSNITWR